MIRSLLLAAAVFGSDAAAQEPVGAVGLWRYDDAAGTLGLRLNLDGSCSAIVGPTGGRAHVVGCSYRISGPKVEVIWHFLEGRVDPRVPTDFVYLAEEGTLVSAGAPDMPMKRVRRALEWLAR